MILCTISLEIFQQGQRAYKNDKLLISDNPYIEGTDAWHSWNFGLCEQMVEEIYLKEIEEAIKRN